MKIGIFHYSMPPVTGGVEKVIAGHVRLFRKDGHSVVLLCDREQSVVDGEFPLTVVPTNGDEIVEFITRLRLDVLIVHNILTMPFNLSATGACHELARGNLPVISWIHDIAATSPYYQISEKPPDNLLRQHPAGARIVAVSEQRAAAYQELTGFDAIKIIPNGVEGFSESFGELFSHRKNLKGELANAYPILFYPTRILRRKNIGLGISLTAELKAAGYLPRLLISGAPEPYSGAQEEYREVLQGLSKKLKVENEVIFLGDNGLLSDLEISQLYQLSDALFFVGEHEGFGLPILEAGLRGLPIFATDTQPLAHLAQVNGFTFPTDIPPLTLSRQIVHFLETNPSSVIRHTIRRDFDLQMIYSRHIMPLLENLSP